MTSPRCLQPPTGAALRDAVAARRMVPALHADRVRLRAPVVEDFALWADLMAGQDAAQLGGPLDAEAAWEAFCVYTAGWLLHGHGLWAVETTRDAALIGFVQIGLEWDDPEPELGYMLTPAARGNGYATEAAQLARAHALSLMDSVVSYVDPGNLPSQRVAARLGAARDPRAQAALGDGTQVWRHGGTA